MSSEIERIDNLSESLFVVNHGWNPLMDRKVVGLGFLASAIDGCIMKYCRSS